MSKLIGFEAHAYPRSIPVVVTTAELSAATFDEKSIELAAGAIKRESLKVTPLQFCAVNYRSDDRLSVKSQFIKHPPREIGSDLAFWQVRTVFVVHAPQINKFLEWVDTHLTKLMRVG